MRYCILSVLLFFCGCGPSAQTLQSDLDEMKQTLKDIRQEIASLKEHRAWVVVDTVRVLVGNPAAVPAPASTTEQRPSSAQSKQCQATTKAGKQCSRMAQSGSDYCWQHQSSAQGQQKPAAKEIPSGETTKSGQTIYTGPRGGKYHYSPSGKKVYEKKK